MAEVQMTLKNVSEPPANDLGTCEISLEPNDLERLERKY